MSDKDLSYFYPNITSLEAANIELKENIKLLNAKKESLKLSQEVGHFGSWEIDLVTHKSIWSEQSYKIYKLDPKTTAPTLETFTSRVIKEDKEKIADAMKQGIEDGKIHSITLRVKREDNVIITVLVNGKYIYNDTGQPTKLVGTTLDITKLIQSEEKQRKQAQILEQIQDSVISTDLNNIITYWNNGAQIIHGYTSEEMLGKPIYILYPNDQKQKMQWIQKQCLHHGIHHDHITKITKNGDLIYTNITTSVLKNDKNEIIGIIRYSQDITEKKKIEDKLKEQTKLLNFQAYHDALTKLPNRTLFDDKLKQLISYAHHHNEKFALFFIDLDNFKRINDTLGHHFGDEILKIITQRLSKYLDEGDILSRVGGDEFTLLKHNLNTSESIAKIAKNIIRILKPKVTFEGHDLYITVSIGISRYPKDSIIKDDLVKYADLAMYKAKDKGKNNYQFYSSEMTRLALEKATIESALHKAIIKNQFVVYYQPQIDVRNNSIVGLEALVRWEHPKMGLLLPGKFIPIAEESNFIQKLDTYVMIQAMKDIQQFYEMGLNPGVLSLNISIKQLINEDFLQILTDTIAHTKFNVQWLEFEITESHMMLNPIHSIKILQVISDLGIKIAIDDFGTGYSSLAYLKKLPVNKLKIDRSFIRDLPDNEEDMAITEAIISMAKSLKLSLIAEGVEDYKQVQYLMKHECYVIQGYFYAKALSKEDMILYLQNNRSSVKDYL